MASVQCQKPSEQIQSSTNHQKTTTTETCHCKKNNTTVNHNEKHSFTEKVKEMAHSAQKMFNHQSPVLNHTQKPATNKSSTGGGVKTEKKKKVITKKTEGQDGHCMPKMLDHMKNKKKNKNKDEKHGGGSSESGSSSESEDEKCKLKN